MATFHVAVTGSDTSGTGSVGSPWLTPLRAINTVAAGDTIELHEGTYTGTLFKNGRDTVTIQNFAGDDVIVQSNGASNTWVLENCRGVLIRRNPAGGTFMMRNSPTPVIPSAGAFVGPQLAPAPGGKNVAILLAQYVSGSANPFGLTAASQPFLTVDGLIITDSRGKCIFGNMIGVVVRNCDLSHGSIGVLVDGGSVNAACNGTLIEDCDIHDMDKLWQDFRVTSPAAEGDDSGAMAVHINRHSSGAIVRRCRMWNNTCYSSRYVRDGAAFEPFRSSQWHVYECEMWDNEIVMETGTASGYTNLLNGEFHHNFIHGDVNTNNVGPAVLMRTGNGTKLYNNTFVMDGGGRNAGGGGTTPKWIIAVWPVSGFGDKVQNLDFRNNIFVNTSAQTSPGNQILNVANNQDGTAPSFTFLDYNLVYSPFGNQTVYSMSAYGNFTQGSLATFRANTPHGDHDIWNTNPLLNAQGVPQPGSPAINAGVAIAGFTGPSPDMGYVDTAIAPPTQVYVTDTFNRSVTAGWGATDNGLTYSLAGGVAADYNVDGDEGTMSTALNREQRLLTVLALNITGTGRVRVNKVPTGTGGCTIYHNVRRVQSPLTCYRFKILFQVGGTIRVALGRNDQSATEVAIGSITTPSAVSTFTANTWYRYRYECWNETAGVASLRMRLWPDGGTEPSTWDMNTTNSIVGPLQQAGHLARFAYVDAGVTNGPVIASFDDTIDSDPVAVIPPETYHGSISATARSFMTITGHKAEHGDPAILAHIRMDASGTLRYPAPPGRQSPPYLLPEALAGAPVGFWNRTDPEAVNDDPDNPDANDYVGLTKGAAGTVTWRFPPPSWALDAGSNLQKFEIAMRNPSGVSQDFRVYLMELTAGVWTVRKTGTIQSLAAGSTVKYVFTWTRSDLVDSTGSNVACRIELLP